MPFNASSSSVSAASLLLPVRSTLVAPILPEPIWRTSPRPASSRRGSGRTGSSREDSRRQSRGGQTGSNPSPAPSTEPVTTSSCHSAQRSCIRCGPQRGSSARGPGACAWSKGVFLDRERSCSGSTIKGVSRSISTRSAGAPLARRPLSRPEKSCGICRHRLQQRGKFDVAIVVKAAAPRRAVSRGRWRRRPPRRRAAASPRRPRVVGRDDHVDIAAGNALDHGAAGLPPTGAAGVILKNVR